MLWGVLTSNRHGFFLLSADLLGVVVCFNISYWLYVDEFVGIPPELLLVVTPITLLVMYLADCYRTDLENWGLKLIFRTLLAVIISGMILAAISYLTKAAERDILFWRRSLLGGYLIFSVWAVLFRAAVSYRMQTTTKNLQWVVVGYGERARFLRKEFYDSPIKGSLRFFPLDNGAPDEDHDADVLTDFAAVEGLVRAGATGIVLAADRDIPDDVLTRLMKLRLQGHRIFDLTDFYERYLHRIPVMHLNRGWLVMAYGFDLLHTDFQLRIKRLLDLLLACVSILALSPVIAAIAVMIKLDTRGPVFYSQIRTGRDGKEFRLQKFRTMVQNAEHGGAQWAKQNDPRVTRVGRLLRVCRLDELPQIWNVLLGEMSFIGPRPERPEFNKMLEKEIPYYFLRHLIKPGITGWAQVMYPYGSSIEDARMKLQFDLFYIKNYSMVLDLMIAVKTLRVMMSAKGQ